MEMEGASVQLLSMPMEVLTHIGHYLTPRLLYDVSMTCLSLRTAFNTNSIWRRHSRGALVSRLLEHATSIVEPTFSIPACDTLDPLCDHRLSFIRQSRLLHNLRRGEYLQHNIIHRRRGNFRFYPEFFGKGQIIYKSDYVFIAGYEFYAEGVDACIHVYDIRDEPRLFTRFRIGEDCSWPYTGTAIRGIQLHVVDDKLVIKFGKGCCVHKIDLPSATFPLIHSFIWGDHDKKLYYLDNFVIEINHWESFIVNVLNVEAERIVIKSPEGGDYIDILYVSSGEGLILLSFIKMDFSATDVHVYDVNAHQYTFHLSLDNSHYIPGCVVGNKYVVLFVEMVDGDLVSVYDCETSNLLVQKTHMDIDISRYEDSHIIKDCLVIPEYKGVVKVISLSSLELLYELPYSGEWASVNVFSGLCDLIVVNEDVWDFNERRYLLEMKNNRYVTVNESFTKIISNDKDGNIHVYSFW